MEIGSGNYHFEYETETELKKDRFSFDLTLKEITSEPLAIQLLEQHAPGLLSDPMIQTAYGYTINDILHYAPEESAALFGMVIDSLNKLK
ncbi:hypothetical protein SDC9_108259 [bioreactor metagenome]|uniref:Uncharacterized protein n=2 Tax=root TaxID=1 RepID=A0A645B9S7_9ZZZZ